jgi:hypothetical protein
MYSYYNLDMRSYLRLRCMKSYYIVCEAKISFDVNFLLHNSS